MADININPRKVMEETKQLPQDRIVVQTDPEAEGFVLDLLIKGAHTTVGPNLVTDQFRRQVSPNSFTLAPNFSDEFGHDTGLFQNAWVKANTEEGQRPSGDLYSVSLTNPHLSIKDHRADHLQRTAAYSSLAATDYALTRKLGLLDDVGRHALQRPWIPKSTAVEAEVLKGGRAAAQRLLLRTAAREGGEKALEITARQGMKQVGKALISKGALKAAGRSIMMFAGVGSGGATILTLVLFEVGSYILIDIVIPKINEAMDDSGVDIKVDNQKDKSKLTRSIYTDRTGAGLSQSNIIELDLKDGNLRIGSSTPFEGNTFHLWDSEERKELKERSANASTPKEYKLMSAKESLALDGEGAQVYITRFDDQGNPITTPVDISRLEHYVDDKGKRHEVLNPQYQIIAVAEMTQLMGIADPVNREKIAEMATRHLLSTDQKFAHTNVGEGNNLSYEDNISLYSVYTELYRQSYKGLLAKLEDEHGYNPELPPYMKNFQAAIKTAEAFLQSYETARPLDYSRVTDGISQISSNIDGEWYPGFSHDDVVIIQEYLRANQELDSSIEGGFQVEDGMVHTDRQSTLDILQHMQKAQGPKFKTVANPLAIDFTNGSFVEERDKMFMDILRTSGLARKSTPTELELASREFRRIIDISRSRLGIDTSETQDKINRIISARLDVLEQLEEQKQTFIGKIKKIAEHYKKVEGTTGENGAIKNVIVMRLLDMVKNDYKNLSAIMPSENNNTVSGSRQEVIDSIAQSIVENRKQRVMLGMEELGIEDIKDLVDLAMYEIVKQD